MSDIVSCIFIFYFQLGERQRLGRKRQLYLPEFQSKYPRLMDGLSPSADASVGLKPMCSCPPFECLCRPVSGYQPPTDIYQTPASLSSPSAMSGPTMPPPHPDMSLHDQPPRAYDTSYDFGMHSNNTQGWRDSYSEYFDMTHPTATQQESKYQPNGSMAEYCVPMSKPEYAMPIMSTATTPSMYDQYSSHQMNGNSKLGQDLYKGKSLGYSSDCMYSNSSSVTNVSLSSQQNLSSPNSDYMQSPIKGNLPPVSNGLEGLPSGSIHITPVSLISTSTSAVTTCGTTSLTDLSGRHLDDFEINDAADILSLDQPINKHHITMAAPPKYDIHRRSCSPEQRSNPPTPPIVSRSNMDLSTLLLPSITSIFGEETDATAAGQRLQNASSPAANEHVDRILGLSINYGETDGSRHPSHKPAVDSNLSPVSSASSSDQKVPSDSGSLSPCRGPTPPSLIELQPLASNKNGAMPSPKRFNDIFSPMKDSNVLSGSMQDKGAFHPYNDTSMSKDMHSDYHGHSYFPAHQKYRSHDAPTYYHAEMIQYPGPVSTSVTTGPNMNSFIKNHNINITLNY